MCIRKQRERNILNMHYCIDSNQILLSNKDRQVHMAGCVRVERSLLSTIALFRLLLAAKQCSRSAVCVSVCVSVWTISTNGNDFLTWLFSRRFTSIWRKFTGEDNRSKFTVRFKENVQEEISSYRPKFEAVSK